MPGRNSYYRYELEGPVIIALSDDKQEGTVQYVIRTTARFDDKMSISVRLGLSGIFSQTSHFDQTDESAVFRHNDRKRPHDPVRKLTRVDNSLDLMYFEEVEYSSMWHYNVLERCETIVKVSGKFLVPNPNLLVLLSAGSMNADKHTVANMKKVEELGKEVVLV